MIRLEIEPSKVWHNWHCSWLGDSSSLWYMYTLNYHSTLLPSVQKVYLGYGTEWVGSDGVIALAQTNATFYANYCFHLFVPLRIVLLYSLFYSEDSPSIFQQTVINSDRFSDERSVFKAFPLYSSKFLNPPLKLPSHDALWCFSLW